MLMLQIAGGIILAVLVLAFWPYILASGVILFAVGLACLGIAWLFVGHTQEELVVWSIITAFYASIAFAYYLWDKRRKKNQAAGNESN